MNENVCKWMNDDGDGQEGMAMDQNGQNSVEVDRMYENGW